MSKIEQNSVIQGDCLEVMKDIPDNSIDLILTDPPYLYLKHKLDRPFDEKVFFDQAKRVLKKDGMIVLFGRGTSFYRWNTILANLGFTFKEEVIWDKKFSGSPTLPINRHHETISIHSRGNGKIIKTKVPYDQSKEYRIQHVIDDFKKAISVLNDKSKLSSVVESIEGRVVYTKDKAHKFDTHVPSSLKERDRRLVAINAIANGVREETIIPVARDHYSATHPTQKPVELIEGLINITSTGGGVILDPFAGSGSTAVAAINTGHKYIMIEIDEEYISIINKTLAHPIQPNNVRKEK